MASKPIDILREMDILWEKFAECRAHFPYVPETAVGGNIGETPSYYRQFGIHIIFQFDQQLTPADRERINAIGHWLNQNFIVRLCALLESHKVLLSEVPIDRNLAGAEDVGLLRRLRNVFAHTSGRYNAGQDHRKLMKALATRFGIKLANCQDFPLAIDEVLEPLLKSCKAYARARAAATATTVQGGFLARWRTKVASWLCKRLERHRR